MWLSRLSPLQGPLVADPHQRQTPPAMGRLAIREVKARRFQPLGTCPQEGLPTWDGQQPGLPATVPQAETQGMGKPGGRPSSPCSHPLSKAQVPLYSRCTAPPGGSSSSAGREGESEVEQQPPRHPSPSAGSAPAWQLGWEHALLQAPGTVPSYRPALPGQTWVSDGPCVPGRCTARVTSLHVGFC